MAAEQSVADILDKAADLIEPEGAWMQGDYGGHHLGCYCALGAIRAVGGYAHDINPAAYILQQVVPAKFAHEWNDAPERTQAEVVAKLREAAKLAREQVSA